MQRKEYATLMRFVAHWERTADWLLEDAPRFEGVLGMQMRQRALTYRVCAQDLAQGLVMFDVEEVDP